ncbi:phosphate ABC transporter permease PstA [Flavobacterium sp. UBA5153]|jgi:phosphate transport system permease protein|uniref:phosphate ABC transporter permease PstA n=1 Tax=Flavobacterium sp. UBA5153 TaxID=1946549 RepID=UPI0025C6AC4C|nr:phosphate ABC transporter permease PstA [Flavobacterium sp. UBA5153]
MLKLLKLDTSSSKGKESERVIKNKLFQVLVIIFAVIATTPILLILYQLIRKGIRQINFDFFTKVAPDSWDAMTAINSGNVIPGGILNGIGGTLIMVTVASIIAIPLGLLIGIFLYENGNKRYANIVRDVSDILQGAPSIVLGVISYIWVVKHITHGFSALAGSVSLSIMMLPLIIRSTEETFKMIPVSIKEAGLALGVPYHKIILRVLIPTGLSGLSTGILLALSRVIGETAPLMMTALGNPSLSFNLNKPVDAVPLLIWQFYNDPNMVDLIWSSSLFLVALVLVLNLISKRITSKRK